MKGATLADQQKIPAKTNAYIGSTFNLGFNGQFTVDSSALNKKGNQIKLAEINESNNFNADMGLSGRQPDWDCEYNGKTIGQFTLTKSSMHTIDLVLKITNDQDLIGDVNLNVSSPQLLWFQTGSYGDSKLKDASDNNPLVSTLSTTDNSYQFICRPQPNPYHEIDYPDRKTSTFQNGYTAGAEVSCIPFISDDYNKTDIVHELEKSHGKTMSAKLQNLKRVIQISGSHLPQDINDYAIVWDDQAINVIDANGKMINETIRVTCDRSIVIQRLALSDNLTPQQVYDQTPENSYGFSKQKDGSFIIGYNFSPQAYKMDSSLEQTIRNHSNYIKRVDPTHADEIVKNTMDFYNGALQGTPMQKTSGVFIGAKESTDFTIKDLTPGDDRHEQATGFIQMSSGSSEGATAKYVSVQVIDDENNQMIISNNLLRGEAGSKVTIKYAIPDHYQLVAGQNIPSIYTLKDSNQPITIHLKHIHSAVTDPAQIQSTAKRTIVFHMPDNITQTVVQTIGLKRTGDLDEATNTATYTDWTVDDANTNVTVNGVKTTSMSAYKMNGKQIMFCGFPIPHINGYKATVTKTTNKVNPAMALFTVSFMAVPNENKPSTPVEVAPSKPSAPTDNPNHSAWTNLDHKVVDVLNQSDSGWTMPENNSTYTVEVPADNTIDLSDLVIAEPVHAMSDTIQIPVTKRFKLSKKHSIKHLKHRKKAVRTFKKYRL